MCEKATKSFKSVLSVFIVFKTERKGKRFAHIIHVPVTVRCWQCVQRVHARYPALSSFRQGLCDNVRKTATWCGSSTGIWISYFGESSHLPQMHFHSIFSHLNASLPSRLSWFFFNFHLFFFFVLFFHLKKVIHIILSYAFNWIHKKS